MGQVVGNIEGGPPFLWQNGVMVDVNSLLPVGSNWQLISADDINDAGQIVGMAFFGDQHHAYLLTPVPEPASLAALALGLGGLLLRRRRR